MLLFRVVALALFLGCVGFLAAGAFEPDDQSAAPAFEPFDEPATVGDAVPQVPLAASAPAARVVRMRIAALGLVSDVEGLGVRQPENVLDTPHDPLNHVGWYDIFAAPGQGSNAVFAAHVSYNHRAGPFARLASLDPGAEILVDMDDGATYRYRVFRKQRFSVEDIPMGDLILATDRAAGREWITLITCNCQRLVVTTADGLGECLDRDVVVAERVE